MQSQIVYRGLYFLLFFFLCAHATLYNPSILDTYTLPSSFNVLDFEFTNQILVDEEAGYVYIFDTKKISPNISLLFVTVTNLSVSSGKMELYNLISFAPLEYQQLPMTFINPAPSIFAFSLVSYIFKETVIVIADVKGKLLVRDMVMARYLCLQYVNDVASELYGAVYVLHFREANNTIFYYLYQNQTYHPQRHYLTLPVNSIRGVLIANDFMYPTLVVFFFFCFITITKKK